MSSTPTVEAGPVRCRLISCAAPAESHGYCLAHGEERNERVRRERDDYVRSQAPYWLETIGLPRAFWSASFDDRPTAPLTTLREYRDTRGVSRGRAIALASPTGLGKTYAAGALINNLLPHVGMGMRFYLAAQLVRELLDFDTQAETMEAAASCKLLVLDDLQVPARAEGTALVEEVLLRRHADGLPLVITTNLRRAQFEMTFGDRIADRMRDWGEYHELRGKSLRGGAA